MRHIRDGRGAVLLHPGQQAVVLRRHGATRWEQRRGWAGKRAERVFNNLQLCALLSVVSLKICTYISGIFHDVHLYLNTQYQGYL